MSDNGRDGGLNDETTRYPRFDGSSDAGRQPGSAEYGSWDAAGSSRSSSGGPGDPYATPHDGRQDADARYGQQEQQRYGQPQYGQFQNGGPQYGDQSYGAYGQPGGYPGGGYGAGPYAPRPSAGLAITSMVLGILALFGSIFLIGGLLGIVAIVLGIIALVLVGRGRASGKGMAIAGIVTGVLGLLIAGAILAFFGAVLGNPDVEQCVNESGGNASQAQRCLQERSV